MIQSTARREAEEFARVIDGPASADTAGLYAELTRTVTLLREHPRPVPRPEFVLDLRERLMTAAETDLVPATPRATPVRTARGRRRLATIAAAAVVVGGTAGVAAAAEGTLPGDNLYPIKRGLESIQLQLNASDSARGRDLLAQAGTRLQEARDLLAESQSAQRDTLIAGALADAADNANAGADLLFTNYQRSHSESDIAEVREFASDQMGVLGALAASTGVDRSDLGQVGDALAAIDQQARVLCAGCSDLPAAILPSAMLDLTSVKTQLTSLVTAPTNRASHLESLAKAAQHVVANSPETTTDDPPPPHTTTTTSSTDETSTAPHADKTQQPEPVKDLLTGLGKPSKSSLPGQLSTVVNGVTSDVTGVLDDTLDVVGGLLGGGK